MANDKIKIKVEKIIDKTLGPSVALDYYIDYKTQKHVEDSMPHSYEGRFFRDVRRTYDVYNTWPFKEQYDGDYRVGDLMKFIYEKFISPGWIAAPIKQLALNLGLSPVSESLGSPAAQHMENSRWAQLRAQKLLEEAGVGHPSQLPYEDQYLYYKLKEEETDSKKRATGADDYGIRKHNYAEYIKEKEANRIPSDFGLYWEAPYSSGVQSDWEGINSDLFSYFDHADYSQPSFAYGAGYDPNSGEQLSFLNLATNPFEVIASDASPQLYRSSSTEQVPPAVDLPNNKPFNLGSAINTAYDLFSFSDVLTDVINGRRSDPGAYISLANYAAQGLNWAAGTDAGKEIVDAIGDLKDPLKDIGQVTGAASSAWGLYKNIEGLTSGDFNVKDVLGLAVNS